MLNGGKTLYKSQFDLKLNNTHSLSPLKINFPSHLKTTVSIPSKNVVDLLSK